MSDDFLEDRLSNARLSFSEYGHTKRDSFVVEGTFSFFVGVCFTLNVVMGTGFLAVGYGFFKCGLILSVIILFTICFLANISKDFLLIALARADGVLKSKRFLNSFSTNFSNNLNESLINHHNAIENINIINNNNNNNNNNNENMILTPDEIFDIDRSQHDSYYLLNDSNNPNSINNNEKQNNKKNQITITTNLQNNNINDRNEYSLSTLYFPEASFMVRDRKFELPELCEIFLGETGRKLYMCFISLYIYGALWAYSSVWSNALATHLSLPNIDNYDDVYLIYLIMYAFLVIPLSCLEFREQVIVQVLLAAGRVILVLLMLGTLISALAMHGDPFPTDDDIDDDDVHQSFDNIPLFQWKNIYILLPIAVYSNIFHATIPSLSEAVKDKSSLANIYSVALLICFFAYSFMAVLLAGYFGDDIDDSANLNWANYKGHAANGVHSHEDWWAYMISYFIVLFPALDVLSAFPLNSITLGNSLMYQYYGPETKAKRKNKKLVIIFRLIASIPPLFLGSTVKSLSTITDFAGVTGIFIMFTIPSALYLKSTRLIKSNYIGVKTSTIYDKPWCNEYSAKFIGVISIFIAIAVLVCLIIDTSQ